MSKVAIGMYTVGKNYELVPCSIWPQYRKSRTSWGINVLGSFIIEIEATDGTVGFATGFGGM